jgi:branched-subunit amino acid aminotransferase/4-amino-4-deoxychorismate lyase
MIDDAQLNLTLGYFFFETMKLSHGKVENAKYHLNRVIKTASFLDIPTIVDDMPIDEWWKVNIEEHLSPLEEDYRLKAKFIPNGKDLSSRMLKIALTPFSEQTTEINIHPWALRHSNDPFWQYKMGGWHRNRHFRSILPEEHDILFVNEKSNICETTISNIYLLDNDTIYTPPLADGVLMGTYRQYLLDQGTVTIDDKKYAIKERSIPLQEINDESTLFLSNSLRGLHKAMLNSSLELAIK